MNQVFLLLSFYSLILAWVTSKVLPSIRNYGQYELFDNPNNNMFKIENETDLHCKVVQYIRRFYPDSIIIAGLGENQDTPQKRISSWRKGYAEGQPDMIVNNHKDFNVLCIEFKNPNNNDNITEAQKEMKKRYRNEGYKFIISNDYEGIVRILNEYMNGLRIPCRLCRKQFISNSTLQFHIQKFHPT